MSCKTMSIDLANVPPVPVQIGVAGENSFRTITFDASKWGADYPDATYTVVYRRSDGYLYPVLVNASADAIVWSPTETDTAVSGNGQLEVRLLDGETIGKTIIMQTYVAPSLSGDESEPSTPAPDWVNDVVEDADRAEAALSHYPKIVNGVWFVWDAEQSKFVSTGISAQGEDGVSPTVTVTEIEGGHRVTIADADGAHTFDVMDGEGGGSGAVQSVNGQTGAVVLEAEDVGALPDDTQIPSKTSDLTNDSGFVTAQQAAASAPVQSVNGKTGAVTLGAADVHALPDSTVIPPTVTEQTVAGWGFTKNTGTYSKPSGGIPKTDLAEAVRTSLDKADTALQSHQDISGKADKTDVYTKTEVDQKLVGAMDYKGTKATVSALPTSGNKTGDVWHITADGSEWAWNGSAWEELGTAVDLSGYATESWVQNQGYLTQHQSLAAYRTASAQDAIDAAQDSAIVAKYTKPSGGIPASDLASGVIPSVPQMATQANTQDWAEGKVVDAFTLKTVVASAVQQVAAKYTKPASGIPASDLADGVIPTNAYRSASIPMGHLDATSTATVMTATVDGITELRDGVCMWLRNGVITSASGFTLNVNGLGAKPCYSSLAAASRSTTIFNANYTMLLIYNSTRVEGGCWDIVYGVDTNTTYTPPKLGFGYGTCTTAAATAAKTASISSYALTAGGIVSIKFDNDVPANATLNISSKGAKAIYFRGAAITAGVIKAGDTATFVYSTYYHLISIDRDEAGDTLPAVTASDNGKFLRVVNGAWAAATVQTWQGGSY